MQKLLSYMRSAAQKYHMIEDGDRIAVGVSGGKDSIALLCGLAQLRRFYPKRFTLVAVSADPCFGGTETDYSPIEALCRELEVEYIIRRTQIGQIIFDVRRESNPCSLCAKMRRGCLHDICKELGCNKLALGHHMDDAAETFYMNLLRGGKIGCFSPVTYLSRKDLYLIRPLIFAREYDCARVVRREGLPVVKSVCPNEGVSERQNIKELLHGLSETYDNLIVKTIGAMQRAGVDGWGFEEENLQ